MELGTVATDRTKVIFRPNSIAINSLQLDNSITTTFKLILNETSGQSNSKVDEFTAAVVISARSDVQLTWNSGRANEVIQSESGISTYKRHNW